MKRRLGIGVLLLALVGGGWAWWSLGRPGSDAVEQARAFYASQPRHLRPVPYTPVPEGLIDLRAESCGACHVEIYQEWRVSTHARAWLDDAQFQEELRKATAVEGQDYGWTCVNCHTPLENQLERLVVGLEDGALERPQTVPNPNFDPALQLEAITCATCHVRDGVVLGPYGDTQAPHPVRRDPDLLTTAVCTQCHQATQTFPKIPLGCFFTTGEEFANGPWAEEGYTCQRCHMPEVERPLTPGGAPRRTRRHWFGGSLIPKRPEDEQDIAPLRDVYPNGLALSWVDLPASLSAETEVTLRFAAVNAEAGHALPTGDPERYLLIEGSAKDSAGKLLGQAEERIGAVYDWDTLEKVSDNRLDPRERREYELVFRVPSAGSVTLELVGSKWRINPENLKYHDLEGRTVPGRVFTRDVRSLPVAR